MLYKGIDPSEALRTNITLLAKKERHTYIAIADSAGVTYRTLKYFLDGERDIAVGNAALIAGFFDMTLVGLINWRERG